jgi:hypothetical protein
LRHRVKKDSTRAQVYGSNHIFDVMGFPLTCAIEFFRVDLLAPSPKIPSGGYSTMGCAAHTTEWSIPSPRPLLACFPTFDTGSSLSHVLVACARYLFRSLDPVIHRVLPSCSKIRLRHSGILRLHLASPHTGLLTMATLLAPLCRIIRACRGHINC